MSNQYRAVVDRYYLDTLTVNKRVDMPGNKVMVIDASSEAAKISVEAKGSNLQGTGALPLQNRDYLATPIGFEQVVLSWAAQPGAWVDVLIITVDPAPTKFEYVRQQRGTIDSIANTVNVASVSNAYFKPQTIVVNITDIQLVPANPLRKEVLFTNTTTTVNLLIKDVGLVGTYTLLPGYSISFATTAEIWGRSSSGAINIGVVEI